MPKIIHEKIKTIALEKYRNGESYNKIASDSDLKSGWQIVRLWMKRYNINNEANFTSIFPKGLLWNPIKLCSMTKNYILKYFLN
ncbi:hypothetical protein [Spiroplasma endosymbiont of Cantharis rufa]|uniref:hypothetical protein n=1 Tax=Spiroplasma endosymbiont of Cantharis rufa TaxID=3066279 RepID=UPI0030D61B0A